MYIVITGGGKVGEYLATVLLKSGNEVAIIERRAETADRLSMILQGRYPRFLLKQLPQIIVVEGQAFHVSVQLEARVAEFAADFPLNQL